MSDSENFSTRCEAALAQVPDDTLSDAVEAALETCQSTLLALGGISALSLPQQIHIDDALIDLANWLGATLIDAS